MGRVEVVDAYCSAWDEVDPVPREAMLRAILTEDAT